MKAYPASTDYSFPANSDRFEVDQSRRPARPSGPDAAPTPPTAAPAGPLVLEQPAFNRNRNDPD